MLDTGKMRMKLEDVVTSLELSKKLAELGVKQESLFYWMEGKAEFQRDKKPVYFVSNKEYQELQDMYMQEAVDCYDESWVLICSAFTVAELGEMLPRGYWQVESTYAGFRSWYEDKHYTWHKNLTESLGGLICCLIENNLLKL